MNSAQAINIFYKQVELVGGLPFNVVIPNKKTRQTFEKTDQGKDLVVCENLNDMFKKAAPMSLVAVHTKQ